MVESDSCVVINRLNDVQVHDKLESKLMGPIRRTVLRFVDVVFVHILREGNCCADALAKHSLRDYF